MTDEIDSILDSYHTNTLWEMAHAAGLKVTDSAGKRLHKKQLVAKMRAEFFSQERVLASLGRLSERERAVLDRLLLQDGTLPTRSLRREVVRAKLVTVRQEKQPPGWQYAHVPYADGYTGNPNRANSAEFVDVIARLTYHGLVFSRGTLLTGTSTPYKLQFHPGDTLFVPEVIRRHLPQPEPVPIDLPDLQPDLTQAADPALLLRDLYLYWDFVRRNEVPLLQSGLVGKRSMRAINGTLLRPDSLLADAGREDETGWLYLLRTLLEALGLLQRKQGQLRPAGDEDRQIPAFWSWPVARQTRAGLDAWLALRATNRDEKKAEQYGPRYTHARQMLISALRALPAGTWFDVDDLLERIRDRDVDFLFPEHARIESYRGSWYYGHSGSYYYGSPKDLLARFEQFEQRFIQDNVTGMLHSLGIVDLGQIGGRWSAFRLAPGGQEILGEEGHTLASAAGEEALGKIVVQPNFQILAIGPVDLSWLARFDLFADRQQADRGAFGYELSRDSVYRAMQHGMEVDEILRWLQDASEVDLPQNVYRSLQEWGAYHDQITFRRGVSLLQAADAGLLAELWADPQVSSHLARSVSPEVALLKQKREKRLISTLVAQGLFPAVAGAEPQAADASVLVREDGLIRPVHVVPSLHLRGRLARLAEECEDGTWRITADSVGRAAGSKGKVDRLLEELGKLQRGTLPHKLVEQIRAWGGYYGNATAGTLTLIEFRDQEALDSLRHRPELQAYLIPFPAGSRALASVPGDRLAEVKEILARFGVTVREGL